MCPGPPPPTLCDHCGALACTGDSRSRARVGSAAGGQVGRGAKRRSIPGAGVVFMIPKDRLVLSIGSVSHDDDLLTAPPCCLPVYLPHLPRPRRAAGASVRPEPRSRTCRAGVWYPPPSPRARAAPGSIPGGAPRRRRPLTAWAVDLILTGASTPVPSPCRAHRLASRSQSPPAPPPLPPPPPPPPLPPPPPRPVPASPPSLLDGLTARATQVLPPVSAPSPPVAGLAARASPPRRPRVSIDCAAHAAAIAGAAAAVAAPPTTSAPRTNGPTMPTTRWTTSCARWSRRVPGERCSAAAGARADLQRRSRRPRRPCRPCRPSLAIAPLSIGSLAEAALPRCRRRVWGWAGGWKGGRMHVMVRMPRPARATRPVAARSPPASRRRHALRWLARHVPRGAAGGKKSPRCRPRTPPYIIMWDQCLCIRASHDYFRTS